MHELQLREEPAPTVRLPASIGIDQMSWWFWIKAGIGLMIGAGIVWVTAFVLWVLFLYNIMVGITARHVR